MHPDERDHALQQQEELATARRCDRRRRKPAFEMRHRADEDGTPVPRGRHERRAEQLRRRCSVNPIVADPSRSSRVDAASRVMMPEVGDGPPHVTPLHVRRDHGNPGLSPPDGHPRLLRPDARRGQSRSAQRRPEGGLGGGDDLPSATSCSTAARRGASHSSGPGPPAAARTASAAAAVPAPGAAAPQRQPPRRRGQLDGEDARRGWRRRRAACAPPTSRATRGPPASRSSASCRCSPGTARRRFSATIAACVYWAIISPELTPASGDRNGGRPCDAARGRAAGRCAAR